MLSTPSARSAVKSVTILHPEPSRVEHGASWTRWPNGGRQTCPPRVDLAGGPGRRFATIALSHGEKGPAVAASRARDHLIVSPPRRRFARRAVTVGSTVFFGGSSMTDSPVHMRHMPDFVAPLAAIVIDHAEGSWVYATDGTKWLDFVMGIAVMNTGHAHPRIIEAVKAQAAKVSHAQMNIYRHQPMLDLSDKLAEIVPEGMDTFVYTNSGAEAVENAVKLAKQVTRRPGIIAFQGAFHGRTHLTMALTDSAVHYRGHHEPLVGGIYHARYCYPYRTPASEDPTAYAIEDVRRVLRAEVYGDDVAGIIVEPIQGEGGFIV